MAQVITAHLGFKTDQIVVRGSPDYIYGSVLRIPAQWWSLTAQQLFQWLSLHDETDIRSCTYEIAIAVKQKERLVPSGVWAEKTLSYLGQTGQRLVFSLCLCMTYATAAWNSTFQGEVTKRRDYKVKFKYFIAMNSEKIVIYFQVIWNVGTKL